MSHIFVSGKKTNMSGTFLITKRLNIIYIKSVRFFGWREYMKKIIKRGILVLLIGTFLTGCNDANKPSSSEVGDLIPVIIENNLPQEAAKSREINEELYINETYGYSVKIPQKLYEACNVEEIQEGKEIYFGMKDGNDMVMTICTLPNEAYEEQLGMKWLSSNDKYTVYIQFPTCGTLNNEAVRDLWNQLIEEGQEIKENDLSWVS